MSNGRIAQRFEREIGILARLHHRGIPQLFCVGKINNGLAGQTPFMALEYIEGEDICSFADSNRLAASDRVALVAQVCDAVAYAHHHGVIHRDLKPANILVDLDGDTKVLDFGLATLRDPLPLCIPLTQDGDCLGTLDYVSPEQASGELDAIDQRTDVYALGVILFELLTGAPPYKFAGASWSDAAKRLLNEQPIRLSRHDRALRGDLETIVLKAMARDRAIRYPSAKALADDLRRFLAHQPIQAKPPTQVYLCKKFIQRNKGLVAATATVFLSLCLGLVFRSSRNGEPPPKNRSPKYASPKPTLPRAIVFFTRSSSRKPERSTSKHGMMTNVWGSPHSRQMRPCGNSTLNPPCNSRRCAQSPMTSVMQPFQNQRAR